MSFYREQQNAAAYSKYPFSDTCSLLSQSGYQLPNDFMLDLSMCVWGSSAPYLSSLSAGTGIFSDDSGRVARFSYTGPGVFPVYDMFSESELGVIVLGKSASGVETLQFSADATTICPACFCLFDSSAYITSVSCEVDGRTVSLRGNVRISGKNGIYVTKVQDSNTGALSLRVDAIGHHPERLSCCNYPIRMFIISNSDCPPVSGAVMGYPDYVQGINDDIIPGVIALHSPMSADMVCGRQERYIDSNGNIGFNYCDRPERPVVNPCEEVGSSMLVVVPANGNIDLIPFSPENSGSPVYVHSVRAEGVTSFVSGMSDPSMKNLAMAENSGTVVVGLKGRS